MLQPTTSTSTRFGISCAIGAQVLWGCFPLYIYATKTKVDAFDFVAHRAFWSFALLAGLTVLVRFYRHPAFPTIEQIKQTISSGRAMVFGLAAVLIAINWVVFVWAVTHGRAMDASLGYYICPQVVVLLGVIFEKERLSRIQWAAVFLAACGVAYMARSTAGIPWPALLVAGSFGLYALVKKRVSESALTGLTLETSFMLIPAIAFLAYRSTQSSEAVLTDSWLVNLLLLGSGIATVAPLALYSTAVKHIPLSTVGLLQFVGPTLQFVISIFVFGEPFDSSRLIGFVFVWVGVALYLVALNRRRAMAAVSK